ncbi:MAG TPA: hypothetical protein VJ851_04065 [Jatrophihabitans sp.]|nr:hypothetical protein [Jatrophihabitans sp.]
MNPIRTVARGVIAGAVGTTALNAVTYLDMAVRARPASEIPQQAIETMASRAGHPVPGTGAQKQNRLAGLGSLSGIATGVGIGMLAGLGRPVLSRLPAPIAALAIGVAAMVATNGSLVRLGLTDPRQWSWADWLSDLVPHLAYGAAGYATLRALEDSG